MAPIQIVIPLESEITVSAGAVKVAPDDEMIAGIDRTFGEKVAELG